MTYEHKQAVYLPAAELLNLEFHLMDIRPGIRPDAFVAELVKHWLTIETERLALHNNGRAMRGFQWKNIFLLDGTCLRTNYCDIVEFAKVNGNHIVTDDGTSLTPSLFANRHAKGRNAWRFVWLRFPGNDYWVRAANYRTRFNDLPQMQSTSKVAVSKIV